MTELPSFEDSAIDTVTITLCSRSQRLRAITAAKAYTSVAVYSVLGLWSYALTLCLSSLLGAAVSLDV